MRSSSTSTEPVKTDKPTFLLFLEICHRHKDNYNLTEWINKADWDSIRDAGRDRGFTIPELALVVVKFRTLEWTPRDYLETERTNESNN